MFNIKGENMTFKQFLELEKWSVARFAKAIDAGEASVNKWKYHQAIPRKLEMLKIYKFTKGKVNPNSFYGID